MTVACLAIVSSVLFSTRDPPTFWAVAASPLACARGALSSKLPRDMLVRCSHLISDPVFVPCPSTTGAASSFAACSAPAAGPTTAKQCCWWQAVKNDGANSWR